MISILTEPAYSGSIWCKELLKSLTDRLRQKRIPFCEIFESIENNGDGVFIIASDYNWIKSTVSKLNSAGIKPILICNQAEQIHGCDYSCVCSDINGSILYSGIATFPVEPESGQGRYARPFRSLEE